MILPLALFAAAVAAAPLAVEQGAIWRGQLPAGSHDVLLDGKPVRITPDGRYIIGFGRDAPPAATLTWQDARSIAQSTTITVTPRQWQIQSLPTLPVLPVPDAEFTARRPAELAQIAAARAEISDLPGWQGGFIAPAKGPISGIYGSQRILSGTPSAPHAGLDFAAPAGSAVVAPAAGIVRLASGPFTLEGNLVMIDHGFGLVSAFLHLSRLDVKPGDLVAQGQRIGLVGATGRATGPHLHWAVSWTDVRIDPAQLLEPKQ